MDEARLELLYLLESANGDQFTILQYNELFVNPRHIYNILLQYIQQQHTKVSSNTMQRNNLFYLYQFVLLGGAAIGNLLDHNFRQLNKEERGRGEAGVVLI